jgi:uncharacterized protein (TIGR03086 family)
METKEVLQRAVDQFQSKLDAVGDNEWHQPTPCSEWDVHALVNHVASELRWIPPLMEGKAIADVGDSLSGDLLGDDPKSAWSSGARQAVAAASEPGALQRTVHLSYGDREADGYIREVSSDLVIHAWDLAKGVGGDARLDPALVELAAREVAPAIEGARAAGYFGPAVSVPADADPQTRLLALTGRDPNG